MVRWIRAFPKAARAAPFPRARRLALAAAALAALPAPAAGQADRREDVVRTSPGVQRVPARTAETRDWSLDVSIIAGYDGNPSLTPNDDPRDAGAGGFIGTVVNGSYRLYRSGSWTVTAGGVGFWSKPFEAPHFSVIALRPNLGAEYRFDAWRVPVVASAGYGLDATFVGGRFFDLGHTLSVSAAFPVAPLVTATPSYALSFIDFGENARDAVRQRVGTKFSGPLVFTRDALVEWQLGYAFTHNDARSGLFDYNQHGIAGGLGLRLRPGLFSIARYGSSTAQLGLGYARSSYPNYPTSPARHENIVTLSAGYATPILAQLFGSVALQHRIEDANLAAYSTRRTSLTFALTWRF